MECLRKSYERIINASPEVLEEITNEVNKMNDIALHNLSNSIVRNDSNENIDRGKIKATATMLVYDLIMDIVYREDQEQ